MSIADICTRSGASVGSIYHHFGSKEGIVEALLLDGLALHLDQPGKRLAQCSEPRQAIAALIGTLVDWVDAHPRWAMFIYVNLNYAIPARSEALHQLNREYAALIDAHFGPAIDSGAIAPLPRECWSSLITGPVHDYARRWLRGQVSTSPRQQQEVFTEAAWKVLRPSQSG